MLAALLVPTAPPAVAPRLVDGDGADLGLAVHRWRGTVSPGERLLLERAVAPVLDVGCGPGRVAAHLAWHGVSTLGIDIAEDAVRMTRARGAPALRVSVFGAVPGEATWATAVLLDGNLGIGGDPPALLARVRALLAPAGRILVELEPPGTPSRRLRVRLHGWPGGCQPWAQVGVDGVEAPADAANLAVGDVWETEGRWFAQLDA